MSLRGPVVVVVVVVVLMTLHGPLKPFDCAARIPSLLGVTANAVNFLEWKNTFRSQEVDSCGPAQSRLPVIRG